MCIICTAASQARSRKQRSLQEFDTNQFSLLVSLRPFDLGQREDIDRSKPRKSQPTAIDKTQ